MRFPVEEAEMKMAELIDLAQPGEQVIIEQGDRPVAEIIPIPPQKGRFRSGLLKDVLTGPAPDFLEPMSEEELLDWEGRD